jgi:toxin ParE1/3/4
MIYKTTTRADEDIIGIYVHGVREFGARQAENYHRALVATFDILADNPFIARERQEFRPPVWLYFYKAHTIVYRIMRDHVLIIRVLHGRQDWERHL